MLSGVQGGSPFSGRLRGAGGVPPAGRAGPGEVAARVLSDRPAGLVFQTVMVSAKRGQVVCGGTGDGVGDGVVEVAAVGGLPAAGEAAGLVAAADVGGERCRRPVGARAD